MNWLQQLLASLGIGQPPSFFQTRITHTPGVMVPGSSMPRDVLAYYAPGASPLAALAASNLTPDQKATIARSWANAGNGMITAQQSTTPGVWHHESLHDLQAKSPDIQQHLLEIAARVNPALVGGLQNTPVYQREIAAQGLVPTIAREGSAIDLIPGQRDWLPDPPTPALKSYYMQLLQNDPVRARQFQQLTDTSTLPVAARQTLAGGQ